MNLGFGFRQKAQFPELVYQILTPKREAPLVAHLQSRLVSEAGWPVEEQQDKFARIWHKLQDMTLKAAEQESCDKVCALTRYTLRWKNAACIFPRGTVLAFCCVSSALRWYFILRGGLCTGIICTATFWVSEVAVLCPDHDALPRSTLHEDTRSRDHIIWDRNFGSGGEESCPKSEAIRWASGVVGP